jgi:hypothetical protein
MQQAHSVTGAARQIYNLKVVPTIFQTWQKQLISNQFSYTQNYKAVDLMSGQIPLPGVFFKWDFDPLMIVIHEVHQPWFSVLVRFCAVLGGTFVIAGLAIRKCT